MSNTLRKRYVW